MPQFNKITKRVCLADSIAHCLQAIASENRELGVGARFVVREVEINENDDALIHPKWLKDEGKVPDALENNEYWYLNDISCNVATCEIIKFDSEFDLAWTCIPPLDCEKVIRKYSDVSLEECQTSLEMYQKFYKSANENEDWSAMDDVWDELSMIPWVQKVSILDLDVKYL